MALIIEDGTIVAGAQSLVTVVELAAYAAARGVTLPATEPEREVMLVKAMDYIDAQEPRYQGTRTSAATQLLSWPRAGVWVYGAEVGANTIPAQAKQAQLAAAVAGLSVDLMPASQGGNIKRERVDVIETEYTDSGKQVVAVVPAVDAALRPLLSAGGASGATIQLVRVL